MTDLNTRLLNSIKSIKQTEIADYLEINSNSVSQWIKRNKIPYKYRYPLAIFFKIDLTKYTAPKDFM